MNDFKDTLTAFAELTQLDWRIQDMQEYHLGGEDYIFIFIGLVVLYIIVSAIIHKNRKK